MRLEPTGPVGFGKAGSFEGFCSGGGIARLARSLTVDALEAGQAPLFCPTTADLPRITAEQVGLAAQQGDALALHVYEIVARKLGYGLAILIDILNPELIVIGSIFGRQRALIEPLMVEAVAAEAIPSALAVCRIVPAGLGERIGDLASLAVALHTLNQLESTRR